MSAESSTTSRCIRPTVRLPRTGVRGLRGIRHTRLVIRARSSVPVDNDNVVSIDTRDGLSLDNNRLVKTVAGRGRAEPPGDDARGERAETGVEWLCAGQR